VIAAGHRLAGEARPVSEPRRLAGRTL
jgi:hypothetical protein